MARMMFYVMLGLVFGGAFMVVERDPVQPTQLGPAYHEWRRSIGRP